MTENNLIESLIDQAVQAEDEAARLHQEAVARAVERLNRRVQEALGDFWPALAPYRFKGEYSESVYRAMGHTKADDTRITLWVQFRPIGLKLAPFFVMVKEGQEQVRISPYKSDTHDGMEIGEMAKLLKERREAFPAWYQKWINQETTPLERKLSYYGPENEKFARTAEEADQAVEELTKLAPEMRERWEMLRQCWQRDYDEWQARQRREEAQREAVEGAKAAFRVKYWEYLVTKKRAMEMNQVLVEAVQAEFDEPKTVYQLTFGLAAQNEDGDRWVDVDMVYVADPEPVNGYWQVLQHGQLRPTRYFSPVSLEAVTVRPTDGNRKCAACVNPGPGMYVWWFPWAMPEAEATIRARLMALEALPEKPGEDEVLDWREQEKIQKELEKVLQDGDGFPL